MALSVALPLSGLETDTFPYDPAFGLRKSWEILGLSQSSPSPSLSSDADSSSVGSGSLGSLKSESITVPSSPQNLNNKVITPAPEIQVAYKGRDILDLGSNINMGGWKARYAFLPSNNTCVFFANRSQYHRLSEFHVEHPVKRCNHCSFMFVDD